MCLNKNYNSFKPLNSAYLVLHTFAQSLQLDALFCQVNQLNILSPNYIKVEEYNHNRGILVISYWQINRNIKRRF